LFLIVCTPSGVSVESMIQVGTARPPPAMGPEMRPCRCIRSFRAGAVFLLVVTAPTARASRVAAAALTAFAALPAAAHAASWAQAPGRCYVSAQPAQREAVPVAADGFTPNARIEVLIDGVPVDSDGDGVADFAIADPGGHVSGSVRAPYQPAGVRPFTVALREQANPANVVSAASKVAALSLELRPPEAPPSSRVQFLGRGFKERRPVWGHYILGGKLRTTVRLAARTTAPCGTFSVRRRQIPVAAPKPGRWTLQVDQQRRFSAQPAGVSVRIEIHVHRVMRAG
jgi:hypothetical protein